MGQVSRSCAARLIAAFLAASTVLAQPAGAAGLGLDALMAKMAEVKESRATFREEKSVAALSAPLVSFGTLHYVAPDSLEKHTTRPVEERLAVTGNQLTLEKPAENSRQVLRLDQQPEIRALVESIRATLAGDRAALESHYAIELAGTLDAWRMTLTPRDPRVQQFLERVRLEGTQAEIRLVVTEEADGDASRMTIEPAAQ